MGYIRKVGTKVSIGLLLAFAAALLSAGPVRADTAAEVAAKRFLNDTQRAKNVLSYLHFGSSYDGHKLRSSGGVTGPGGKIVPGHFNLRYRYYWGGDGVTDVIFFFDQGGNLYELRDAETNAILNQPFLAANATLKLLGAAVVAALGDNLKADDKDQLEKLVNDADAKAMLTWVMKFERNVLRR